jgi:hypothetical protein
MPDINIQIPVMKYLPAGFQQWVHLFTSTVDELFAGEKALLAKQRAVSISTVMQIKILNQPGNVPPASPKLKPGL